MTSPNNSLGFITIAFGPDRYIKQAEALAASLHIHMPGIPVALVCDRPIQSPHFNQIVLLDKTPGLGTLQKAWLDKYTPYDETLFIDSDCLATRPFQQELEEIRRYEFSPVVTTYFGPQDQDSFYFRSLPETMKKLDVMVFPKFNGGVYFFRKGEVANGIFETARQLPNRKEELGLISFDSGGPADETIIGLALAKQGYTDLYNDNGRLMRTPINIKGPLTIDVLGGGCSFIKGDELVTPAICHFAAPYSQYWPYYYNRFLVMHPHSPQLIKVIAKAFFRIQRKIVNKYKSYSRFK